MAHDLPTQAPPMLISVGEKESAEFRRQSVDYQALLAQAGFESTEQIESDDVRTHQGTGLGLAISKKYMELLGGSITVSSELNKGSTFKICLPKR